MDPTRVASCAYEWCLRPVGPKSAHAPYCASCYTRRNWRKRQGYDPDLKPREYRHRVGPSHNLSRTVWPCACLECGAPLPATGKRRLTCGQRCHDARRLKRRPTAKCELCGYLFHLRTGTSRENRFCSYSCKAKATAPEPRVWKSTPLAFASCVHCHAEHVTRATSNKRKQRCCMHLCACGEPVHRDGDSQCWPCFYAKYRDSFDRSAHRRRMRLLNNGPIDSDITRQALAERDGWHCHLCGKKVRPSTRKRDPLGPSIDHILPVSLGGTHTWDNVALAHDRCNRSKGVRPQGEQLLLIGQVE